MMDETGALVLVVDDVDAIVEELLTLLSLQGLRAIGATRFKQAVAIVEGEPRVRVIACDVRLDRESGLDIVSLVQNSIALRDREFQYVFITGDPMSDSLSGMSKHSVLTKPVQPRALLG